jgi:hypothetical protein
MIATGEAVEKAERIYKEIAEVNKRLAEDFKYATAEYKTGGKKGKKRNYFLDSPSKPREMKGPHPALVIERRRPG